MDNLKTALEALLYGDVKSHRFEFNNETYQKFVLNRLELIAVILKDLTAVSCASVPDGEEAKVLEKLKRILNAGIPYTLDEYINYALKAVEEFKNAH